MIRILSGKVNLLIARNKSHKHVIFESARSVVVKKSRRGNHHAG